MQDENIEDENDESENVQKISMNTFLFWLPRILSLLFIGFVSIFAFDVFGEYEGWELAAALFIHFLPSLGLLAATVIAWRDDLFGAFAFFAFAAWYVWWAGLDRPLSWYLLIAVPATIVGILYLLNWLLKQRKTK